MYNKDILYKILKLLKKEFKHIDSHFLEIAVLQYLFLDNDENYKPDENNELYLSAKENYKKKEFSSILLDGEYNKNI
jgi:hypothetical protein